MHRAFIGACSLVVVSSAAGQLRLGQWNVTNYSSGRVNEFGTAIYGTYQGRRFAPDVLVCQEFVSQAGVNSFLSILNTAPGSPGDWAAAAFVNGPDTDSACFYRTSRAALLGVTVVATGGTSPNHPRNIMRYDVRPAGYVADSTILAWYSSHMKAQDSGSDDDHRRELEAQRIHDNAAGLNPAWNYVLSGDFNIQDSSDLAYQILVRDSAGTPGRLVDPIATPGKWYANMAFRFVHTQDPAGSGGMDDRHDQILLGDSLVNGNGFDYLGLPSTPYSTTTWNDPNHSYRAWGNDGTSFDMSLTIANNQMVGPTIAQALVSAALTGGHLPVFLDLIVPAQVGSEPFFDLGDVPVGESATVTLHVSNTGDTSKWSQAGIDDLDYSLSVGAGFSVAAGPFAAAAGGPPNPHVVTMDTSAPGPRSATLVITSDAPDQPVRLVQLVGNVVAPCPADFNGDGFLTGDDFDEFVAAFEAGDESADYDGDGFVSGDDFDKFNEDFAAGC